MGNGWISLVNWASIGFPHISRVKAIKIWVGHIHGDCSGEIWTRKCFGFSLRVEDDMNLVDTYELALDQVILYVIVSMWAEFFPGG